MDTIKVDKGGTIGIDMVAIKLKKYINLFKKNFVNKKFQHQNMI